MFDVLGRITELKEERGWTMYRVAKNSGIPQSSLSTWYAKKITPPVDAIDKMCRAFNISLSEFFDSENYIGKETGLLRQMKKSGMTEDEQSDLGV